MTLPLPRWLIGKTQKRHPDVQLLEGGLLQITLQNPLTRSIDRPANTFSGSIQVNPCNFGWEVDTGKYCFKLDDAYEALHLADLLIKLQLEYEENHSNPYPSWP